MTVNPEERRNPYVGPRPFETGERLYGRDRETRRLLDLLLAERIVLLYSPSGAGKTSLVQAGLIPQLGRHRFQILPIIRTNAEVPQATARDDRTKRHVLSALLSLEEALPKEQQLPTDELAQMRLDAYLGRRAKLDAEPSDRRRENTVLIFDQFEEILTVDSTNQAAKAAFFEQVGAALCDDHRWALFSMREEYIAALDPYLRSVPTRFGNRFRLDLLGVGAARLAIREPAREVDVDFTEAAAGKLVEDLCSVRVQQVDGTIAEQRGPYIEPVHLQVVCRRLWDHLSPDSNAIVEADLAAAGDVDAALAAYYAERVTAVAAETGVHERAIRDWFDRRLITEQGLRGQVQRTGTPEQGLADQAVQALVNAHLVRADSRRGLTWYELAHDRLIEPIRADNATWLQATLSPLQRQAIRWQREGRPDGQLLRDRELTEAEGWAAAHPDELMPIDGEFLEASREARAAIERERREARHRRQARVLAVLAVSALTIAVVFLTLAYSAFRAGVQARFEADRAQEAEALARAEAGRASAAEASAREEEQRARDAEAQASAEAGRANAAEMTAREEERRARDAEAAAEEERQQARNQARVAKSREMKLQALGQVNDQPDLALLLSLQAKRTDEAVEVRDLLLAGLGYTRPTTFLRDHAKRVLAVAFSPDGRTLASGGEDGAVVLSDLSTGRSRPTPAGQTAPVNSVAFSPDGRTLASGDGDGRVVLRVLTDPARSGGTRISAHPGAVRSVAYSPDGAQLASGGEDGTIRLWETGTGRSVFDEPLPRHAAAVRSVAISPDGRTLASGSEDKTVSLWDATTGRRIGQPLTGHAEAVNSVAFSPDGRTLASGSEDNFIRLWDVGNREQLGQHLVGHTNWVMSVSFSGDGRTLASGSADATVLLWDVQTGRRVGQPLAGHADDVSSVAFSPDGKTLASGSDDRTVILWDVAARQPLTAHSETVWSVAFSPDDRTLASGSADDTVRLWNLATRRPVGEPLRGHAGNVWSVAFSLDGGRLASGSGDRTVGLWDVGDPTAPRQVEPSLGGHTSAVRSVAFSSDGVMLASGSMDGTIRLWETATGRPLRDEPLPGHAGDTWALAFGRHPNGRLLASGGCAKRVDSTCIEGEVRLWDVGDPAAPRRYESPLGGHARDVWGVAFSPDGRTLASAGADGTIILWDVSDPNVPGQLGTPLTGHRDDVRSVAFSPDGLTLASGGQDGAVILWDVEHRRPVGQRLTGHDGKVWGVAFNRDGTLLASASEDKTIILWDVSVLSDVNLESWRKRACRIANRDLTMDEWAQFVGSGIPYERVCPDLPAGTVAPADALAAGS